MVNQVLTCPYFFGNSIIGVIGITGDPEVVLPFAALLRTATELLISQNQANQIEKENENRLNRFFCISGLKLKMISISTHHFYLMQRNWESIS
ncbi:sugar diacid recognition domain-containing protein [Secundilactobacillus collinoides]|uniref:sugar diacid recognition domain-containing protein n=1 Tax=Secundilactobacillus collinoides TaxID=33960 RepID=UPI001FB22E00|nr:sugar diacid recognition domain-containing protein [Secundilactobacillus collinoides]